MPDTSSSSAHVVPGPIASKLSRLRREIALWFWADGLSRILLFLLAFVLIDLVIDWSFRMDRIQRLLVLVIAAGLAAYVIVRRLVRPLASGLTEDILCLRVEDRHRELGESLISAVQFSRSPDAASLGLSPDMMRAAIAEGTRAAEGVDFADVLDKRELRLNILLVVLAAAGLAALTFAVLKTEPMWTWFDRNVLLGSSEWPQDTYLTIKGVGHDNTLALPRGDDWLQVIEADPKHVVPPIVYLDYKPLKGRRITEQLVQVGDHEFHTTFKNMLDEFQFRVRGGDDSTDWVRVSLVDRPAVNELELVLSLPAYVGQKPEPLPAGRGPYDALKGSRIEVSGIANKELARAKLSAGETAIKVRVDGRRFYATIDEKTLAAATYSLDLTSADGLDSKRPTRFTFKIRPDREPSIRARLEGVSGMIVAAARIPVVLSIRDDFAVTDARLVYQWRVEGDQTGSSGQIRFEALKKKFPAAEIAYQYPFEAGPLGLAPGSTLAFHIEADDNDNVSAENGKTGRSDAFLLRVVTEEELRADLLRREKEQRQEVERLLKDQEELQTECRAILATVTGAAVLPDEQRLALIKAQKRQYLASERCGVIARQLGQLMAEVENNRLEEEDGPVRRRLEGQIIAPLEVLASPEGSVRRSADLLDEARRVPNNAKLRDQHLTRATQEQQRVANALREILKHMAKSEGYQEAVNLLYAILKSQSDVNSVTAKEAQQRIKAILEGSPAEKK